MLRARADTSSPETPLGCPLASWWVSVFRPCLGWRPHLADVALGPDSNSVASAQSKLRDKLPRGLLGCPAFVQ